MRIIDKCQWTYLKGSSSDHCIEAKSEEAFLVVHGKASSGSHAPLFWAKFHIYINCTPIHELTIFSFGGKPQQRIWNETKKQKNLERESIIQVITLR
jgi:hypothetical protein